jgi:predicted TIM-barrel fold metal-dependent hydrolase
LIIGLLLELTKVPYAIRNDTDIKPTVANLIDCDSHVLEPSDLWTNYLERKHVDRAIRIEVVNGTERLIIGEQVVLEGVLAGLGGAHIDKAKLFTPGMKYSDGCPTASFDPIARVAAMDEWGVTHSLVFPTICILPFPTEDQELANAYCRAYNNWMADFAKACSGRVWPVAIVNWHDVDEAERELKRCIESGCKALFVPPETVAGKRPGDARFDRLWRICEEANVPGCLHVIVRFSGSAVPFAEWHATSPGPIFGFGLGATGQLIPALTSIVTDGLFERFPRLKIVSVEAGAGYAPYLMDRLDAKYDVFKSLLPLPRKPSEYIQSNCYFVAEPMERTTQMCLQLVGEDRIMWGSDYPHIDGLAEVGDHPALKDQLSKNAEMLFGG